MADPSPIQGELQAQIMSALWRLEAGTVEQVRSALPTRYRSAYTTVQTVLNLDSSSSSFVAGVARFGEVIGG